MKIQKDVALALATVAAIVVALFATFVTIPVWFEAAIITLAVVGIFMTIGAIVNARKDSYDEIEGTYTYKFPFRAFVWGVVIILLLAAIILLCIKALFGFALIPTTILLAVLFIRACIKKNILLISWWGLLIGILVVVLLTYWASTLVNNDLVLNPSISTETTITETEAPETKPTEPETKPTEPETKPTEPETKPTEPETKPTEPETKPEEEIKPDPVDVKINAPKVMRYAEPITVTLEGCKATNLYFTDEEYYSIVVVSETEVTVTLVGVVLDDGTVELIPFSKFLTIYDNESGVYVTIDIVDNDDTTTPETQEPEIKEEEKEEEPEDIVEDIEKPEEETEPTVPETKPEEEEKPVVVEAKIYAPKTIVYAEPIIITLEGIKAENLMFSNEDFLSIVIVSDSEVEVTLIGIVNDAGEVEFIPGSGYITVTDSVSGVNAYIEIVEAEEDIYNEPEIKDEEDKPVIDTPVEEVEKPEIKEEVTPVEVKINAPKVMYYAEPITVTLEGCKATDLYFTDEEYYSIVVVSETEVTVTLVGVVLDDGTVELIPFSKFLTIYDNESGVYVIIDIVDNDDTTTPETQEPEIKEEEKEEEPEDIVEDIEKPEEETEPTVPETKPEEEEKPVVVEAKIYAPKTIVYAEPIIITLEGIKAENLMFSNEDFLSVVIISDSEVEVTLIGIVNDAGEVEFIPGSGYITVTDSVSGVNAYIEIVEAEEDIYNEPEIKDEEDEPVIETPVEEVEKPEIKEEVTPVEVKINAPEIMVYAEPVIITLDGIKAQDLEFSNEEFFSIVIISETEVEITLVGIVNDAGEVEIVPECGYVTITDSVSGVHTTIEIVG